MQDNIIHLEGVKKCFGNKAALNGLSFSVRRGEILGLLGPNGSGKTTTIRLITGVIYPDEGRISVDGLRPEESGDIIRSRSGVLTESAGLYGEISGIDNLNFFGTLYGVKDKNRVDELIRLFDMEDYKNNRVSTYSTGMKKRLGLARALLNKPEILFLDEPTNGLDPEGIRMVLHYIKKLNKEYGTTIIICSHILHELQTVCDRYVFLERGRVIEEGTIKEIENKYLNQINLKIETSLNINSGTYMGYEVKEMEKGELTFILPSKEDIPKLLNELVKEAKVYSVEILNRSLETLYFKVRGKNIE